MSETINRITASYQETRYKFSTDLREIVEEYSKEYSKADAQTELKINSEKVVIWKI